MEVDVASRKSVFTTVKPGTLNAIRIPIRLVLCSPDEMHRTQKMTLFISESILFWEYCDIELPKLPLGRKWKVLVNTEFEHTQDVDYDLLTRRKSDILLTMCPRSVLVARVEKYFE